MFPDLASSAPAPRDDPDRSVPSDDRLDLFVEYARLKSGHAATRYIVSAATGVMLIALLPPALGLSVLILFYLVVWADQEIAGRALGHIADRAMLERQYRLSAASSLAVAATFSLVAILVWVHHEDAGSRMLASAFLFGAGMHASLQVPVFRRPALARVGIYFTVLFGLYVETALFGQADPVVLGHELGGFAFLVLWAALYTRNYLAIDLRNRRMRDALQREKSRAEDTAQSLARSQEEMRLLTLVARYARDSVMVTDADRRILWVNDAFTRNTGYPREEVMGRRPDDFLNGPETDLAVVAQILDHVARGEPFRTQLLNLNRAGQETWVDLQVVPVLDAEGRVEVVVALERDVTADRQRERDLAMAKLAAEQGARAKSDFLATMSHEIRTPMNGILGMAEVLADAPLDADGQACVSTIRTSAEALLKIINDVLDLSKLDAGRLSVTPHDFSLRTCVLDVVDLLRPEARARGLTMDVEIPGDLPAVLTGDDGRIRQILVNLVGNAIKFTETGGLAILLRHRAVTVEGEERIRTEITVEDSGIGISEDRLDAVFAQFAQADSATTRRYGGTGLGLTISRMLAEAMGGTLTATSMPGVGSRFTLSLPLAPGAARERRRQPRAEPRIEAGGDPVRVLVAEDNEINRIIIGRFLADQPIHLSFACDGEEAIAHVARDTPELVFMDMSMPVLDGLEATRRIRAAGGPQPRIVALTANAFDSDRQACLAAGMDDFMTKPIRRAALIDAIARTRARSAA